MGAIQSLCKRTIVLSRGEIEIDSQTDAAVQRYISDSMNRISTNGVVDWSDDEAPGEYGFFLKRIEITSLKTGDIQNFFNAQEAIEIRVHYKIKNQIKGMRLVIQILTQMGVVAFTSTDHNIRDAKHESAGSYISKCSIPGFLLNNGKYIVRVWSGVPGVKRLLNPNDYLSISITGGASHGSLYKDYNHWPGAVCPKIEWEIVENGK
jgi:lipopolysaccharide transport system ATP-binding protein